MKNLSFAQVLYYLTSDLKFDFDAIKNFSDQCPPGSVVDFGAGYGRTASVHNNRKQFLVENCKDMINLINAPTELDIEIKEEHAHNISIPSNSVSLCTFCWATLGELRPLVFAIGEAARVLKKGGGLYTVMLNSETNTMPEKGLRWKHSSPTSFTASITTLPYSEIGQYEYQTQMKVRNTEGDDFYIIKQAFPPANVLAELLKEFGFNQIKISDAQSGLSFDKDKTKLYQITAIKESEEVSADQKALKNIYNSIASRYDSVVLDGKYQGLEWLKRKIKPFEGSYPMVLDLGCGNGISSNVFKELNIHGSIYGIDFSEEMILKAREKNYYKGLIAYDLNKRFPIIESLEFDMVLALGVLEFVSDIDKMLKNIRNILTLAGEAFLTFELTTEDSLPSGQVIPTHEYTKYHYTKEEIVNKLSHSNLHIIEIEEGPGYFSPTLKKDVPYLYVHVSRRTL
ncbi:MAG: methyltransferase domain-containing protein [Oligoflexia bacterium]|nr:methyltransferase domain-containing protein [Oligoflexia bacterium]